jgi:hypothetical protein
MIQMPQVSPMMPTPIAPPPRVLGGRETTARDPWSSCHGSGKTLDEWAATLPCGGWPGNQRVDSAAWFGCLLVALALVGAATDVMVRRKR